MSWLVVFCERCADMSLLAEADCVDDKALCGACGHVVRALPDWALASEHVPVVRELCSLMAASGLVGVQCIRIAAAVEESLLAVGEHEALQVFAFRVPALKPLLPTLGSSTAQAGRAVSLATTLLRLRGSASQAELRYASPRNERRPA